MRARLKKKLKHSRCLKCGNKTNLLVEFDRSVKIPKNYKKFNWSRVICKHCDKHEIQNDPGLRALVGGLA